MRRSRPRAVAYRHRYRAIQLHHRRRIGLHQQVIQSDDLYPVPWQRRSGAWACTAAIAAWSV